MTRKFTDWYLAICFFVVGIIFYIFPEGKEIWENIFGIIAMCILFFSGISVVISANDKQIKQQSADIKVLQEEVAKLKDQLNK